MSEDHKLNARDVAKILSEMADYLEIKGENQYKIRAYQRAAWEITGLNEKLVDLWQQNKLTEIDGVGEGLAESISEIFSRGSLEELEELKRELPDGIIDLLEIPGLGPKRARKLFYSQEIGSVEDLNKALESGEVRTISGFGEKLEQKLQEGIERYREYQKYYSIDEVEVIVAELEGIMEKYSDFINKYEAVDGYRRRKDLLEEIIFLISVDDSDRDLLAEKWSNEPEMQMQPPPDKELKYSFQEGTFLYFIWQGRIEVVALLVSEEIYPYALQKFTGSSAHNKRLQEFCENQGYSLPHSALYENESGDESEIGEVEEEREIYEKINLSYIIPELREGRGEISAAYNNKLPDSPHLSNLKGDLHIHTHYSDGTHSLQEMVSAASEYGYEYIAITDHSISLRIADGLSAEKLRQQGEKIDEIDASFSDVNILKGGEVDILSDGSLDYEDGILSELDLVIASVHSGFNQSESEMTSRIVEAARNPRVDIIGHPQGRLLKGREAYEVNMEKVIEVAAETGTCLEINASPSRLDLDDEMAKKAAEAGVKMAINTDAHSPRELKQIKFGLDVARRGWLEKSDIINTYSYEKLCDFLG